MSWIKHDLRCPQEHDELDVLYRRSEGPPPCPTCQEPRHIFYATLEQRAGAIQGFFKEYTIDGGVRITSPEGERAYLAEVARKQGVPVESVQIVGRGNIGERVDELRHRAIEGRRRSGFDERDFRKYKEDVAQRERKTNTPRVGWRS